MKVAFTRLMAMSVLAFPLTVLSQAHVSLDFQELESPIVLPDDGWYQIQTNSTVSSGVTVCEGVRSCEVTPGFYMIINHTVGTRRPVSVRSSSGGSASAPESGGPSSTSGPIQVSGNTISWASDTGWHQVQSAVDYSSACEGGTSCVVSDGLYVVINHTTGVRYENIRVGESGEGSDTVEDSGTVVDTVTLTGNTFSLPSDGWYQVQDDRNYLSICEGVATCTVPENGPYKVINHTTGERWNFTVDSIEAAGSLLINEATWETIVEQVVDVINTTALDQLAADARGFGEQVWNLSTVGDSIPSLGVTVASREQVGGILQQELSCDAGGSVSAVQLNDYSADQCQTTTGVVNGAYQFGPYEIDNWTQTELSRFSIMDNNGYGVSVDGSRKIANLDEFGYSYSNIWADVQMVIDAEEGITTVINFIENNRIETGEDPDSSSVFNVTQSDGSLVEARQIDNRETLITRFNVILPAPLDKTLTVSVHLQHNGDYVQGGGEFNNSGLTVDAIDVSTGRSSQLTMNAQMDPRTASWTYGSVSIRARDGSSVALYVDTDDSNRFDVDLNNSFDRFSRPWTEATTIFCEGPFGGCARD